MRIAMPNPAQPVSEGGQNPIHREWFAWLRRLIDALGFTSQPIYVDLWPECIDASLLTLDSIGGINVFCFDPTGTDIKRYEVRLPNNYKPGTAIKALVDWAPQDATAGAIVWRLVYVVTGVGSAFPGSATSEDKTVQAPAVAAKLARLNFTDIPGAGRNKGDVLLVNVQRRGDDAGDTYAATVFGILGLKYQVDGLGWETANP